MFARAKGKATKVGSTATVSQEQCIDHIPYFLFELSRAVLRQLSRNSCIHF